jgi:hypothetical protein
LCSLRFSLVKKTVASALREVSNKQVAIRPRITHKAERLVELRGRLASSSCRPEALMYYCGIAVAKRQPVIALLDERVAPVNDSFRLSKISVVLSICNTPPKRNQSATHSAGCIATKAPEQCASANKRNQSNHSFRLQMCVKSAYFQAKIAIGSPVNRCSLNALRASQCHPLPQRLKCPKRFKSPHGATCCTLWIF